MVCCLVCVGCFWVLRNVVVKVVVIVVVLYCVDVEWCL